MISDRELFTKDLYVSLHIKYELFQGITIVLHGYIHCTLGKLSYRQVSLSFRLAKLCAHSNCRFASVQ